MIIRPGSSVAKHVPGYRPNTNTRTNLSKSIVFKITSVVLAIACAQIIEGICFNSLTHVGGVFNFGALSTTLQVYSLSSKMEYDEVCT